MIILGIETSCDETGISIYDEKNGILINKIHSQKKIHSKYGGIVPNLASKYHYKIIIKLLKKSIKECNQNLKNINAIAYTAGPGLSTSLLIGATTAITLAYLYNKPSIPINHIEGHIMSVIIKKNINFPFLSLMTSGANTYLIIVFNFNKYKIIGKSLDDSAGEAFDKIANKLGLKYPGGKKLSILAKLKKKKYNFPRPMIYKKNLNFSFSGLKTYTINKIKKYKNLNITEKANIAYAFEESITDVLVKKTKLALKKFKLNTVTISGGVSANKKLKKKMIKMTKKLKINFLYPKQKLCTDNAAMIAYTGLIKLKNKKNKYINKNLKIKIKKKWKINKNF